MMLAERNAAIVQGYLNGETQCALASRFGLTQGRVSRILNDMGAPKRAGRPRIMPTNPSERQHYIKVRALLGADAARRAVGI